LPDRNGTSPTEDWGPVLNRQSGYIRYVDIDRLIALAKAYRICVHLERRVGQFVPAGVPLARVSKPERVPTDCALHIIAAFDIGPTRTMQQDVEFGIIQIVDIALRAISPAVNDPSTAISCVDQPSRIMIHWISRTPPPSHYYAPPHVLRLFVPWMSFDGLLYTDGVRADQALCRCGRRRKLEVNARLQRHCKRHPPSRSSHQTSGARAARGGRCAGHLPKDELVKFTAASAALETLLAA
jgi:uncharacterized membrane protein